VSKSKMPLSHNEKERYSRQILLPEFGIEGQERLAKARVLLIGAGGLSSPAALYLAAMGVGTIGIIDDDNIAVSNLHRQILYRTSDIGKPKAIVASERILEVNENIIVRTFPERLTQQNALSIMSGFDLVLDGSDNFSTRYLVNDACLVLGIPLVSASILRFEGQITVVGSNGGPCYRCLFPEPPNASDAPSCAEAGVIGALAGVMGTIMAMEAAKLIAKIGEPLVGRLLIFDALNANFRIVRIQRDTECMACSIPKVEGKLMDSYEFDNCKDESIEISWKEFLRRDMPLIDVREEWEFANEPSEGILIPLRSLAARLDELPNTEFAIVCAAGIRSMTAVTILKSHDIKSKSIRGGMQARDKFV
jgi:molybdopterin/thiamine biosynthesis adenylyltransferase/rhodanese-related sulfurtransferase